MGAVSDMRVSRGEKSLMPVPGVYGLMAEAMGNNETLMLQK